MVAAVFSAIGDALARDEAVTIAGFGKFVDPQSGRANRKESPDRGARRHRRLEGAFVQGRQGPSRRGQRLGGRANRPGSCRSPRQRPRRTCAPSSRPRRVPRRLSQGGAVANAADSPHVRTPAQTSGAHRFPRARISLYGEPQDCSDDSATGQCARLMHHPLPSRFRPAFAANGSPASIGPRRRSRHRAPADPSGARPRSP